MLVVGLERRAGDAGRRVVDEHVERAERGDLRDHAVGGDVAAHEDHLGAKRSQLLSSRFRCLVVSHVADPDALGAVAGEAERDRAADATRAARDEDVHVACGSGASADAELGISSQPSRRADSRGPSSAFEEA